MVRMLVDRQGAYIGVLLSEKIRLGLAFKRVCAVEERKMSLWAHIYVSLEGGRKEGGRAE